MGAARSVQITFVRWPIGVGEDMVLVGTDGLTAAAGGGAGLRAGADQVFQLPAGHVAGLGVLVVARATGDLLNDVTRDA
jgi:hypothetical protein